MSASAPSGLAALLGSERVVGDPGELERWSSGGRTPRAVVFPRSVEELAELLGRASDEGWDVLPAGAGTWADGGGAPRDVSLVVSTREMRSVVTYEPGDLTLRAGAGLTLGAVDQAARANSQWLPQDPPGGPVSTLGAFVATGLPGPLVAGFGRPRDQLLGLTAVTGDGRVIRPGGGVVKNVAGFDLVRLLAGSWGTLAVVADVTVRLFPRPEKDVTLVLRGAGAEELAEAARALATAPVVPDALELVQPAEAELGGRPEGSSAERGSGGEPAETGDGGRSAGGAVLLARVLGSEEAVREKVRILVEAVGGSVDRHVDGPASGELNRRLSRLGTDAPLSLRLSLLPSRLPELLEAAGELRARASAEGALVRVTVHATRGILRLEVERAEEPGSAGRAERGGVSSTAGAFPTTISVDGWAQHLSDLRARLEALGGSLFVARAPRELVDAVGARGSAGGAERLLERLKAELDPAGILSPGRLFRPEVRL